MEIFQFEGTRVPFETQLPHLLAQEAASVTTPLDLSSMSDEELLRSLQEAVSSMGDGSTPPPDAAFYTLGLSSMAAAQFSGLLEQVSHFGLSIYLSILPDFVYILYLV